MRQHPRRRPDAPHRRNRAQTVEDGGRTSDFVLFALVPLASVGVAGYPLPELAMVVAVGLGVSRARAMRIPGWLPALLLLLLFWMSISAIINDLTPVRRLLHVALFCALATLLAQGRFSMRSVSRGLAAGLVAAALAHFVGLGNAGYEGRLTGLFGDPNVAGFQLTALGAVVAAQLTRRRVRLVFLAVIVVFVILTLSRTSFLAIGLAAVWVVGSRRLSPLVNVSLIALLLYAVARWIDFLRLVGPFSERSGSDALRERIVTLERIQISEHPWVGNGPGTSTVLVDGDPFFFHNSYLALQNEAGWLGVAIFLALGITMLLAHSRLPRERRNRWLEASFVAVATCAANLGEVLLELPTAIVIGAGVWHLVRARAAEKSVTQRRSREPSDQQPRPR